MLHCVTNWVKFASNGPNKLPPYGQPMLSYFQAIYCHCDQSSPCTTGPSTDDR